ncbi:Cyclic nucleotide-binding domain-containing protein [Filomicrobium insigne]|uniref:Cyclic nucleotide-binding domain-containing protein n=1 Tax=Filomicrobium insigne TaxID=418854 RepID=A0A1H0M934_9HYPH|nr:cyclic nucleotide-binding domain-containing protein [Filomicrobium insigne]SDO76923.1 Cyclic nucleotide-binding domain-containing protein [Filomicrobium insigne]
MSEPMIDIGVLERVGAAAAQFAPGERIFVQDDGGDCMYVVRSGRVSIKAGGMVLENIEANGVFGEMSLIDGSPRSATAVAEEPTEVLPIDRAAFHELVRHDPEFALRLMRLLAGRIRRTNESL